MEQPRLTAKRKIYALRALDLTSVGHQNYTAEDRGCYKISVPQPELWVLCEPGPRANCPIQPKVRPSNLGFNGKIPLQNTNFCRYRAQIRNAYEDSSNPETIVLSLNLTDYGHGAKTLNQNTY
jgi:hypothetical protein